MSENRRGASVGLTGLRESVRCHRLCGDGCSSGGREATVGSVERNIRLKRETGQRRFPRVEAVATVSAGDSLINCKGVPTRAGAVKLSDSTFCLFPEKSLSSNSPSFRLEFVVEAVASSASRAERWRSIIFLDNAFLLLPFRIDDSLGRSLSPHKRRLRRRN